jgi:hypothetical protein
MVKTPFKARQSLKLPQHWQSQTDVGLGALLASRFIYLAIRSVFCRKAISSFRTSIMRSNMLRSLPDGMRLYFVMSSESAPCRLRRSLNVLSMKSSMRVITAAQGWVAPVPSVGGWRWRDVLCARNLNKTFTLKTTACSDQYSRLPSLLRDLPTPHGRSRKRRPMPPPYGPTGLWQRGASLSPWALLSFWGRSTSRS